MNGKNKLEYKTHKGHSKGLTYLELDYPKEMTEDYEKVIFEQIITKNFPKQIKGINTHI